MVQIAAGEHWIRYHEASEAAARAWGQEMERRQVLQQAILFKVILQQQLALESNTSQKLQVNNSTKQELSKAQHEKKLLENKVSQQSNEIETLKKKSASQLILQKENMQLKNQITKLNTQISESKNEVNKTKQQFLTQKAVLESKLETAKKNIKNLKDQKDPVTKLNPPSLISPTKVIDKQLNKPQLSNFSVSPFLTKSLKTPQSPTKQIAQTPSANKAYKPHPLSMVESSTPQQPSNTVLAQSTPGTSLKSPSKVVIARRPGSALKNLLSPKKEASKPKATGKKKKASSLFDDDDVEDDDLFGSSIRKVKIATVEKANKDTEEAAEVNNNAETTTNNIIKKKRRKIGTKTIVEVDEDELHNSNFSPIKRVKLLDKLGGISPLKQRNTERNLFRV